MSDLARYITDEIYTPWCQNRKALEEKWNRNIDAYRSISIGTWKKDEGEDWRSDVFVAITRQKIIAAYSLIIDMLLQGGRLPFMLKPSPWGSTLYDDLEDEQRDEIDQRIEDMTKLIDQQLADCHADRKFMKAVLSAAIYGETYTKEIVHEVAREYYEVDETGEYGEIVIDSADSPGIDNASVWDIIRDIENDDLQESAGIFHRQMISAYWLRQQMGKDEFFIDEAIEEVLSELTSSQNDSLDNQSLPPALRDIPHKSSDIEYLEFWGRVPRKVVESFTDEVAHDNLDNTLADEIDNDGDEVEIMACVVNNTVVRFTLNEGKRPFHRAIWEMTIDDVGANGMADNVEQLQTILNGIVRAIDDNTRLSGNSMIAVNESMVDSEKIEFKPGAKVPVAAHCEDVRKAIMPVEIPNVTGVLYDFATFVLRLLDDTSGLNKISQGQVPDTSTGTATEINELVGKSGKYVGGVMKNFDEGLVEPNISAFFHYNMMDPECTCKGNFIVQALGFTSYQNQLERINKMNQLFGLIMSSEPLMQMTKFHGFLEEFAKALDLDVDQFVKSEQEISEENAMPDPMTELEKARQEAEIQEKQSNIQATHAGILFDKQKLQLEAQKMTNDAVNNALKNVGSENRTTSQGPYNEHGMKSNNKQKPVKSVKSNAAG